MRKIIHSILSVVVAVATLIIPVSASGEVSPAASAYFSSYTAYIDRESGSNTLTLMFDVTSVTAVAKLGASRIQVLRSSNNSDWTIVRTYYSDDYPSMLSNSTGSVYAYTRKYTATYNYYYKIYVSFYAYKNATNHGTLHAYSNTVYVSR